MRQRNPETILATSQLATGRDFGEPHLDAGVAIARAQNEMTAEEKQALVASGKAAWRNSRGIDYLVPLDEDGEAPYPGLDPSVKA